MRGLADEVAGRPFGGIGIGGGPVLSSHDREELVPSSIDGIHDGYDGNIVLVVVESVGQQATFSRVW